MRTTVGRVLLAPVILSLAIAGLRAAEPEPAAPADQGADPPAGYILIASARMQDPRFDHTVVLLLKHDKSGAFGIIVNRPVAEKPIAALLAEAGAAAKEPDRTDDKIEGSIAIYFGGPVQTDRGFVLHSTDYRGPDTMAVDTAIAMTSTREILRDIGRNRGPKKYLFALGYAGWGPGQLEGEIERRDWFSAVEDPELVFDAARARVWERALAGRSREL